MRSVGREIFWGEFMRHLLCAAAIVVVATSAFAADEPINLRGMGSFHVGGRIAVVSGKEPRTIQRQPGGPLSKLDPNGEFMVEQMYAQYFLPQNRRANIRC